MKKYQHLLIVCIFFTIAHAYSQKQYEAFTYGDRIGYIGSSIAMNGACFHYTNLFYATRYPDRNIQFINGGISGEGTIPILNRLEEDVLANRPTWCIVMGGGNDLNTSLYAPERQNEPGIEEQKERRYQHLIKNTDIIVEQLLAKGVKVILQTPSIVDEVVKSPVSNYPGFNDKLRRFSEHLKALGDKYALPVVDCWTVLNDINNKIQKNDPAKTIIGRDRIHVGNLGHFIMSVELLNMQKIDKKVSHIIIDAKRKKTTFNEYCTVDGLKANPSSISFTTLARALPFPTPDKINPDSFFRFTDEWNADILQVKGLKKGDYILEIDGNIIHTFSNDELNNGINLSTYHNTPQYKQAESVLDQFQEYWKNERTLRSVKYVEYQHRNDLKGIKDVEQLKTDLPSIMEKYKSSDNYNFFTNMFNAYIANKPLEPALYEKGENMLLDISKLNKPVAHRYSIRKAGN